MEVQFLLGALLTKLLDVLTGVKLKKGKYHACESGKKGSESRGHPARDAQFARRSPARPAVTVPARHAFGHQRARGQGHAFSADGRGFGSAHGRQSSLHLGRDELEHGPLQGGREGVAGVQGGVRHQAGQEEPVAPPPVKRGTRHLD